MVGFDDEEARVQEQENQLLQQDIPVPVSPNQNHKVHMQVMAELINSGQSTQAAEQHFLKHHEFEQRLSPAAQPQRGDTKAAPLSTTPELARRGVPENQDLVGATNNPNIGANKGPSG